MSKVRLGTSTYFDLTTDTLVERKLFLFLFYRDIQNTSCQCVENKCSCWGSI